MGRRTGARCLQGLLAAPCPVLMVLPVPMLPWNLMLPLAQRRLRPQAAFWWGLPVWPPAHQKLPNPQSHRVNPNRGVCHAPLTPYMKPFSCRPFPALFVLPQKAPRDGTPAAHLPWNGHTCRFECRVYPLHHEVQTTRFDPGQEYACTSACYLPVV